MPLWFSPCRVRTAPSDRCCKPAARSFELDSQRGDGNGQSNDEYRRYDIFLARQHTARLAIGTINYCLVSNGSTPYWNSCPSAGTGVFGSDTWVQYNNGGVFGGSANFTWVNSTQTLGVGGTLPSAKISLALGNAVAGATVSNELRIGNDTAPNALSLMVTSSSFTNYPNYAYIYNRTATGLMLFGQIARKDEN